MNKLLLYFTLTVLPTMPVIKFISNLIDDPDPVIIVPFGGYANADILVARARVLEDEGITHSEDDSGLKNLYNSYKRFETDEKAGVQVRVSWQGKEKIYTTDEEGYILVNEPHGLKFKHKRTLHIPVTFELLKKGEVMYSTTSEIVKPAAKIDYIVISDVDDTVLETGVASTFKWRLLVNSLFKHSDKRLPLEGARDFYMRLSRGANGESDNPFFYISNSPWNLYEYIQSFLRKYEFPAGTLMLRDFGNETFGKKEPFTEGHKHSEIVKIIETYPEQQFVLIGDAGELDTDIYISIARRFTDNIKAIYIRSVDSDKRLKRIRDIIENTTDIEVVLIEDGTEAEAHAVANGLIEPLVIREE